MFLEHEVIPSNREVQPLNAPPPPSRGTGTRVPQLVTPNDGVDIDRLRSSSISPKRLVCLLQAKISSRMSITLCTHLHGPAAAQTSEENADNPVELSNSILNLNPSD